VIYSSIISKTRIIKFLDILFAHMIDNDILVTFYPTGMGNM